MLGLRTDNEKQKLHFLQDFDAPVKNVFAFFSDHNRLSEIYPGFIKRIIDSPNPANCNDVYKITLGSPLKNHIGKMNFIELSPTKTRLDYIIEFEPYIPYTGFVINQVNTKLVQDALSTLARKFRQNPNY